MSDRHLREEILVELERLRLSPSTSPVASLAVGSPEAAEQFLRHLRSLTPGATWYDVFPDLTEDDVADDDPYRDRGRPLGSFDYQHPPRGSAVFASAHSADRIEDAEAAMRQALASGVPVHGAGMILDRGHPHFYIVLPLGAPEEHAWRLSNLLREHPGIGNAFPERLESSNPQST